MMKRVAANDPTSIFMLGNYYLDGIGGLHQDAEKAKEHWTQAAKFGSNKAHYHLGRFYEEGGDHYEAAAMTGHDSARYNLGVMEGHSGNIERALKHLRIAASAGHYKAMHSLRKSFEGGFVSRESIEATLTAYNNSCAEMRSEARYDCIHVITVFNWSC